RVSIAEKAVMSIGKPFSIGTRSTVREFAAIINDTAKERLFLSVEYAQLPPASDFVVRVFINLPEANRNTPVDDPHHAGSFTFFGTEPPAGTANEHASHHPRFIVNVTNALQRLRKNQQLSDDSPISVQLVPVPFDG